MTTYYVDSTRGCNCPTDACSCSAPDRLTRVSSSIAAAVRRAPGAPTLTLWDSVATNGGFADVCPPLPEEYLQLAVDLARGGTYTVEEAAKMAGSLWRAHMGMIELKKFVAEFLKLLSLPDTLHEKLRKKDEDARKPTKAMRRTEARAQQQRQREFERRAAHRHPPKRPVGGGRGR